ncbi:MAG: hypothetical protein EGR97_00460 [Clostridiales bacterium]|nr:hypothetical protein [Clostridiales bacterium]
MVGLRTQENDKFLKFWEIVQKEARKSNKTFFLDCGDGQEYEDENIECENLTGWLIDNTKTGEFNEIFSANDSIGDEWADSIVQVKWNKNGDKITAKFI